MKIVYLDLKQSVVFFTIRDKLQLIDLDTGKVVHITQKLFKFFAEYHFVIDGKLEAIFKGQFRTFGTQFRISTASGDEFVTKGGTLNYDFSIRKKNTEVCKISKKILTLSDSYTVDIHVPKTDHVLVMAICIAIDQVVHRGDDFKDLAIDILFDIIDQYKYSKQTSFIICYKPSLPLFLSKKKYNRRFFACILYFLFVYIPINVGRDQTTFILTFSDFKKQSKSKVADT